MWLSLSSPSTSSSSSTTHASSLSSSPTPPTHGKRGTAKLDILPSRSKERWIFYGGLVLVLMGLLTMAAATGLYLLLPSLLEKKVAEASVVDSAQHPMYAQFVSNANGPEDPKKYNSLYFYHVTNPEAVLQRGLPPILQERGPYVFREYYRHQNVLFSDDGARVTYADSVRNEFVPELSAGSINDSLTLLNLPYVKIMSKVGSESNYLHAGGMKVLLKSLQGMREQMITVIQLAAVATAIQTAIDKFKWLNWGYGTLMERMGGNCPGNKCPIQCGIGGVSEYVRNASQLLETGLYRDNKTNAMPGKQFGLLMNASDEWSILNVTVGYGIYRWMATPDNYSDAIMSHFNVTREQYSVLRLWLTTVAQSTFLEREIFSKLNSGIANKARHVQSWQDLPYRQWLMADVPTRLRNKGSGPLSIQPDAPVELPFYLRYAEGNSASVNFSVSALNSTTTKHLSEVAEIWDLNSVRCIEKVLGSNETWVMQRFLGFVQQPVTAIDDFTEQSKSFYKPDQSLLDCFYTTDANVLRANEQVLSGYMVYMGETVVARRLAEVHEQNGGLFVTRTVQQHALGIEEPLLKLTLDPSDPRWQRHAILSNDETLETDQPVCSSTADVEDDYWACKRHTRLDANGLAKVYYVRQPSTYYTGKYSMRKLGQFESYHGQTNLSGIFQSDTVVQIDRAVDGKSGVQNMYGYGAGMSFPNKIRPEGSLPLWIPSIPAALYLQFKETVNDLNGIEMYRFALPPDPFQSYPIQQYISKTHAGLLNLTALKGFPIAVSPVHFAGSPSLQKTLESFGITAANSDLSAEPSYMDVEPITGKTMRVSLSLQIVGSTTSAAYDRWAAQLFQTDLFPVYSRRVSGEVSPELANQFKGQVYFAQSLSRTCFLVAIPLGLLLTFIGTVMMIRATQWNQRRRKMVTDTDF